VSVYKNNVTRMLLLLVVFANFFLVPSVHAMNNICNLNDNFMGFQSLLWDTESGLAKAVYRDGTVFTGKYLFGRKEQSGNSHQVITQLYFDYKGNYVHDAAEYKVISKTSNGWSEITGVNYFYKGGQKYFDSIEIQVKANCLGL